MRYRVRRKPTLGIGLVVAGMAASWQLLAQDQGVMSAEEIISYYASQVTTNNELSAARATNEVVERGIAGVRTSPAKPDPGGTVVLKEEPLASLAAVPVKRAGTVFQNMLFDTGSATLMAESYPQISELGKALSTLLATGTGVRFVIEGHTDSHGAAQDNRQLSLARANAVRRLLLVNHQIDSARLEAIGYGEQRPLTSNDTAQGRRLNRRVVVAIEHQ